MVIMQEISTLSENGDNFRNFQQNIGALVFDLNISRESADWFEESYYSNNFRWNNNFSPTTYLGLAGSYELSWLTLGLKHNTIDHYIYFNNDAKPAQHTGTINISSILHIST